MIQSWHKGDIFFILSVALLLAVSLVTLYGMSVSSQETYFLKQSVFVAIGIVLALILTFSDYRVIERYSSALYFLTLALLIGTLLFGQTIRGTSGWLAIGGFQIQPVEFAKITLIVFLASFISKKKTEFAVWTRTLIAGGLGGVMILLVLKQPDLGSSLVLMAIWTAIIFASGIRWKHMLTLVFLGLALVGTAWFTLAPFQKERIYNFVSPERDPLGSGYNVLQALVAVGSGGTFGKGLGEGSQSQLNFLPEKHTDFIFAVIAEELGLAGASAVLFLYALLLFRIYKIGAEAQDNLGYLIALGIFTMFFVQITVNLGMNMGLLPVTGLTAPLLSYGGSSLLSFFIALGLLGSIARQRQAQRIPNLGLEKSYL